MKYWLTFFFFIVGILVGILITAKLVAWRTAPTSKPELEFNEFNSPKWCLPIEVKYEGGIQTGMACSQSEGLCYKVENTAKKIGGLGNINSVGSCRLHHYLNWSESLP